MKELIRFLEVEETDFQSGLESMLICMTRYDHLHHMYHWVEVFRSTAPDIAVSCLLHNHNHMTMQDTR